MRFQSTSNNNLTKLYSAKNNLGQIYTVFPSLYGYTNFKADTVKTSVTDTVTRFMLLVLSNMLSLSILSASTALTKMHLYTDLTAFRLKCFTGFTFIVIPIKQNLQNKCTHTNFLSMTNTADRE